jgi:hypothetical protein
MKSPLTDTFLVFLPKKSRKSVSVNVKLNDGEKVVPFLLGQSITYEGQRTRAEDHTSENQISEHEVF